MLELFYEKVSSPLGELTLVASDSGLQRLVISNGQKGNQSDTTIKGGHPVLDLALAQLEHYFAGRLICFDTPLRLTGTSFQRVVWEILETIPYGERRSYAWLAHKVGKPRAARAVGLANSRNPLPIFLPCHRVVGSDGSLKGYSSGLEMKAWLLEHERRTKTLAITS